MWEDVVDLNLSIKEFAVLKVLWSSVLMNLFKRGITGAYLCVSSIHYIWNTAELFSIPLDDIF